MIREATYADLPAVLQLGLEMCEEAPNHPQEPDHDVMMSVLIDRTMHPEKLLIVSDIKGALTGFAMAYITGYIFCRGRIMFEELWYTKKEHRGSIAGARLLSYMLGWAVNKEVDEFSINITAGINTDQIAEGLERLGFQRSGTSLKVRL